MIGLALLSVLFFFFLSVVEEEKRKRERNWEFSPLLIFNKLYIFFLQKILIKSYNPKRQSTV